MIAPRTHLIDLLRTAVGRSGREAEVVEHTGIDGSYLIVKGAMLVDALTPVDDPYDEFARDKARVVAARLQLPAVGLVTFRRAVSFRTDAVLRRLPEERQQIGSYAGADVASLTEFTSLHHEALIAALVAMLQDVWNDVPPVAPEELLGERVREAATTMLGCTDHSDEQNEAVVRLVTSILAYALLQMRREEDLDRLSIPWGMRSAPLMLDVVGSYFREARRSGFGMFPTTVSDVDVLPTHAGVFRTALASLCAFLHRIDPRRIDDHALHRTVDDIVRWCDGARRAPSPSIDVVDVALRLAAPSGASRLLEVGDAGGLFAVRARVLAASRGLQPPQVHVFAPNTDAERAVVLRTSGRVDAASDIGLVRRHTNVDAPWDVLCCAGTHLDGRHLLRLLAERLPMSDNGALVFVLPLAVLHDDRYAAMRAAITRRFAVTWVLTSDVESLVDPEAGTCCIVARMHDGAEDEAPARFVVLRRPLAHFFLPCDSPREIDAKRVQHIDAFTGYLGASEHGKNNDEVYVRTVPQRTLRERADAVDGAWFDLLVPPDVLSRILQKTASRMQLLRDIGHAWSGLRTGATEFFVVDGETIATEGLESRAWQRTTLDGETIDNIVVHGSDDLGPIDGPPRTDARILLIRDARRTLEGTNILTRIDRAERNGLHARPTVRHREPWYDLGDPVIADLIIPKDQHERRFVATNPAQAVITDGCIGVTLQDARLADTLALWMNSSLGLFLHAAYKPSMHKADITVRDAEVFPVPSADVLRDLQARRHRPFLHRTVDTVSTEYGTDDPDHVRIDGIRRDRRAVDQYVMENIIGLTLEEQRWIYRLLLLWWKQGGNVRHLVLALVHDLEAKHKLRPLAQWYGPAIDQLPDANTRIVLVPDGVNRADVTRTMFSWQVICRKGAKTDEAIDCASQEEAQIIKLLIDLGKVHVAIPTDAPIIAELLPQLEAFRTSLESALDAVCSVLPDTEIRSIVRTQVRARMTTL